MKFLRVFFTVIICIALVILISGLTIVSTFKKKIQNQVINEVIKETIVHNSEENLDSKALEIIDELLELKDSNDVINSVINDYINYNNGTTNEASEETMNYIINFLTVHEKELERIIGEDIDLEKLTSEESIIELRKALTDGYKETKLDLDNDLTKVVTIYGNITSKKNINIGMGIVAALVVLLGILSLSFYKWMKPLGIVLIISGAFICLIYGIILFIYKMMINASSLNIEIDFKHLLIYGIIELVVGIIMLIAVSIINNISQKKQAVLN